MRRDTAVAGGGIAAVWITVLRGIVGWEIIPNKLFLSHLSHLAHTPHTLVGKSVCILLVLRLLLYKLEGYSVPLESQLTKQGVPDESSLRFFY